MSINKSKLKIIYNHTKTIIIHKSWVSFFAGLAGLSSWQSFIHDLSKFSYIEFSEAIKYYTGDRSPIDNCKDDIGFSLAWQHHKGRNPHHYEYWMDNFDTGATPLRMPYKYAVEMICDYLSAGIVYANNQNKDFKFSEELDWFANKIDNGCAMHPDNIKFVYLVLRNLKNIDNAPIVKDKNTMSCVLEDKFFNKKILQDLYDYSLELSDEEFKNIRESTEKNLIRR